MRSLLAFFALAVKACVSALVFPVGEPLCIVEYCAGNFPDAGHPLAPALSLPSHLYALTNAGRLVCGMPSKAQVRRMSGAYPFFLHDKSARLTVLFLDFVRRLTPSSVLAIQAVTTVTQRGVIEVKNSTGDSLVIFPRIPSAKARSNMSRPSITPPPLLPPSRNP